MNNENPYLIQNNFNITNTELQALFLRLEEDYKKTYRTRELLCNLNMSKNPEKAERIKECGKYITKYEAVIGETLLMNKCHTRLCPVCEKQSAMKRFLSLVEILSKNEKNGALFHFIFTCKNCKAEALKETIQGISAGIRMFMRHYKVENYTRRIEVTYNKKTDEYHPHAHCIVMIKSGILFFKDIEHDIFIENLRTIRCFWRNCCVKNNINVGSFDYQEVYARPLSDKRELIECVKYSVKPISITENSIKAIEKATKGLKLFNGSGIFRKLSSTSADNDKHKLIIESATKQTTYARGKNGYMPICYKDNAELLHMQKVMN